ncbi:MAG: hypothetical protein IT175_06055 [Acidobacteria bacterium]|nr:hypothetical protein [Acidobacteriota bacterium]
MNFRAISVNAPLSESLASVSLGAEVLFWRMVSQADPWGCLPGNARKIHHQCLGLRAADHTTDEVRGWLEELKRAHRVARHRNGIEYLELSDWDRWQPDGYLRQRGPSDYLHRDGSLRGETRPHDKRKSRPRDESGRFSAQPSRAHQNPKNGVQKRREGTSLKRSTKREGAPARAGAFAQAEQFVRNSGWQYADVDLRAALGDYDLSKNEIARLRRLAIDLRKQRGDD